MELYDWQREAIDALTQGNGRVLVVAPTGGGKSLCYQQPAADLPGTAIVITPLIALMADQVTALNARGVPATYLASNLDAEELRRRCEMVVAGSIKLLYVAPERLTSARFIEDVVERMTLSLLAIDEAHCISQWGHDFRPEYLELGDLVARIRPPRLLACTATATPAVRREILERLHMPDAHQILRGFARHNLSLRVEEASGPRLKEKHIAQELKDVLGKPGAGRGTALAYTGSRKHAESVAEAVRALGWRAHHYHAGMSGAERTTVQDAFASGKLDLIAATNAFGMGIDRPDIRLVVHHALTESVEAYYQEVGRAGRDGAPARGLLLISDPDIAWRFRMIAGDVGSNSELGVRRREMLRAMIGYAETSACRHDAILEYFEDRAEELGGCSQCDNCVAAAEGRLSPEPDPLDSQSTVIQALEAIRRLPFAVGAGTVASYLVGHGSAQVRRYDWQSRPQFGSMKDKREDWVRRLLRRFVAAALIAIDAEKQTLHITRRAAEVMDGTRANTVRLPASDNTALSMGRISDPTRSLDGRGAELFERLKRWRRLRADADGVPAYVICHDATLAAIAERRPVSGEDLLAVNGIAALKVQRYGVQLLAEVRAHLAENGASDDRPAALPAAESDREVQTLQTHPASVMSSAEQVLYERLRTWRRRTAVSNGAKLWMICSDEALVAIARAAPRSVADLAGLRVLSDAQLERCASGILDAVNDVAPKLPNPDEIGAGARSEAPSPTSRGSQLDARAEYPRAYERWTTTEDASLAALAQGGRSVTEMASELQRQPSAVRSRLDRLGLAPQTVTAP